MLARRRQDERLSKDGQVVQLSPISFGIALRVATRFATVFGGVLAFALVERRVGEAHGLPFDEPMLEWLRRHRHPTLTRAVIFVTELGSGRFLTLISVAASVGLLLRGNHRAARYVAITAAGAGLMNQGMKALYRRERPDVALRLSHHGLCVSSGHSMASAAVCGALAVVAFTRFGDQVVRAGGCTALVGSIGGRAYLFVHYPSDITGQSGAHLAAVAIPAAAGPALLGLRSPAVMLVTVVSAARWCRMSCRRQAR
jgi:undecaprenyl-diphosphatase